MILKPYHALLVSACCGACAHGPPPAPPTPESGALGAGPSVALRDDWRATVVVDRTDSIVLTLPSGDKQLQTFTRHASFALSVNAAGRMTLRLDSFEIRPHGAETSVAPGATWTGDLGDGRVNALRVSGGDGAAQELTGMVRNLIPRLPAGGIHPRSNWEDSATGNTQVDIFNTSEHRNATWTAGALSERGGLRVIPIHVREDFEQLGEGSQGGRKLSMTSQGRRSGTYYLTSDGRLNGAQLDDSTAMLISIPSTRQVVPTIRHARTAVRFIPRETPSDTR